MTELLLLVALSFGASLLVLAIGAVRARRPVAAEPTIPQVCANCHEDRPCRLYRVMDVGLRYLDDDCYLAVRSLLHVTLVGIEDPRQADLDVQLERRAA